MTPADAATPITPEQRATLLHAAELLEREATIIYVGQVGGTARDLHAHQADILATARALRDMAKPLNAMSASIAAQIEAGGSGRTD